MRILFALALLAGCGSSPAPAPPTTPPASPPASWAIPAGFKSETIPFPLEFAPQVAHQGFEELRFSPGFFDPAAPGYWAYAFVWRTGDPAQMDAAALGTELTAYFRGLIAAVDDKHAITDRDAIIARATAAGDRFTLTAHVFDAFKTQQPLDLTGWASRTPCGRGALWRFVLAPASANRTQLDALAVAAACDQPVPPPK